LPGGNILFALSAAIICFHCVSQNSPHGHAKTQGYPSKLPDFHRLAYAWLIVAGSMSVWAAFADVHGGYLGRVASAFDRGLRRRWCLPWGLAYCRTLAVSTASSVRASCSSAFCYCSQVAFSASLQSLSHMKVPSVRVESAAGSGMLELSGVLCSRNLAPHFSAGPFRICGEGPARAYCGILKGSRLGVIRDSSTLVSCLGFFRWMINHRLREQERWDRFRD